MNNETQVQEPPKRGRHRADANTANPNKAQKEVPVKVSRYLPSMVIILPILALVFGMIKSLGDAFEKVCPSAEGRCEPYFLRGSIPIMADIAFALGIIVVLVTILAVVELLTWNHKEKVAYAGLAMLAVFTAFIASGAGDLLLDDMVISRL